MRFYESYDESCYFHFLFVNYAVYVMYILLEYYLISFCDIYFITILLPLWTQLQNCLIYELAYLDWFTTSKMLLLRKSNLRTWENIRPRD